MSSPANRSQRGGRRDSTHSGSKCSFHLGGFFVFFFLLVCFLLLRKCAYATNKARKMSYTCSQYQGLLIPEPVGWHTTTSLGDKGILFYGGNLHPKDQQAQYLHNSLHILNCKLLMSVARRLTNKCVSCSLVTDFTFSQITCSGTIPPKVCQHVAALVGPQTLLTHGGFDGSRCIGDCYTLDIGASPFFLFFFFFENTKMFLMWLITFFVRQ